MSGRSVLLIEDDASVVEAVCEALADEGHTVTVAGNGRDGLARLANGPLPDLILLDLYLPEVDGHEFRRRQLAEPALAAIPTFIFTASAPPLDAPTPASGWLRKPVELDTLLALVERHCRQDERPHEHLVHFHEADERFIDKVAAFLGEGLARRETVVAIATPETRQGVRAALASERFDVAGLEASQQLTLLDARETLAALQVRGTFPQDRFERTVGARLDRLVEGRPTRRVRAYGEMVDLLWQAGDVAGAIQLESLWNDLRRTRDFTLLCGYRTKGAPCRADAHPDVLRHHSSRSSDNTESHAAGGAAQSAMSGSTKLHLTSGHFACKRVS
jgi:CheY-like chemotaxis protein